MSLKVNRKKDKAPFWKALLIHYSLLLFPLSNLLSQSIYICDQSGNVYQTDLTNCTTTYISTAASPPYSDIAYSSSGLLYGLEVSGSISQIDPNTGTTTNVGFVNFVSGINESPNSLTADNNGLLYIATDVLGSFGRIYTFDPANNVTNFLGDLPTGVSPAGDLTFFNGQLILCTSGNQLYSIDINNPGASSLMGTYQGLSNVFGVLSYNCGEDLLLTSGNSIYTLDTSNFSTTLVCNLPGIIGIFGAASQSEVPLDFDLGPDTTLCQGQSINIQAPNNASSYLWSNGAISQNITATTPNTYWVAIQMGNCQASDTIQVSYSPLPTVNLGNDTTVCTSLILDAGNPGSNYLWQDQSTNQNYNVNSSGQYSVEVNSNGCTTSDTIMVTVVGLVADLGLDTVTCFPTLTLDPGIANADSYTWQDNSTGQTLVTNSVGTYSVTVTNSGCAASDTINIIPGTISVTLPNDTLLCQGQQLLLDAGNSGANYLWQDATTDQNYLVTSDGTYSVTVNSGICQASDTVQIVIDNPIALFEVTDTSGCPLFSTYFIDNSIPQNSISNWFWDFGDTTSSTLQNPTHQYNTSGTYNVSLTVNTVNGCSHTTTTAVTIIHFTQPTAAFTFSPVNPQPGTTVDFVNQSSNATNWNWNFSGTENSNELSPSIYYENSGDYSVSLVVTSEDGCIDSTKQTIHVKEELLVYVPNAFTPDGDEYNNIWQPVFTSGFDANDYFLTIRNRWGEIVFQSHDHTIGWDGTYNGKLVADNVFVWHIEFGLKENDARKVMSGHLSILR